VTYTETLDKIVAHGIARKEALTLVLHAEDFGSQSAHGVVVEATELAGSFNYSYDVYTEI
jgi:hypothetical protein